MNLLARKFTLKNIIKPGLILLIPVFFGCESQSDIGIKYDLGSDASVKFHEFTLPATNVYIDSLRTDGENRILVGRYSDDFSGSVRAEGYFQYFYESGPLPRAASTDDEPNPVDTLKLDSIIVLFEAVQMIPYDNSSFQEFVIYELEDTLQSGAVYLSSFKQTTTTEIGRFSQSVNTRFDTLYRIRLDDSFADSFFEKISLIARDPDQFISTTTFQSLGLVPGASSESIAAFNLASDTSRFVMYSSPKDPEAKDTTYLTTFQFSGKNYSYLERDHTGSEFSGIAETQNFDLPSGKTVIDPIMGLSTAYSITPLADFFNENREILINSATVSMAFEQEANRDTLVTYYSYLRKPDNRIFGPAILSNPFGNIVMSDNGYLRLSSDPAQSTLNTDKNKINIASTFFYQQLYRQYLEGDSLAFLNPTNGNIKPIDDIVLISPVETTLQRTIFKKDSIVLKLYYTEVD